MMLLPYTLAEGVHATSIVVNDRLLADAMRATGAKTRREVVELGLASLIRLKKQEDIRELRGKLRWVGDLEEMRRDGGSSCEAVR